jgi:hypothetical protein
MVIIVIIMGKTWFGGGWEIDLKEFRLADDPR